MTKLFIAFLGRNLSDLHRAAANDNSKNPDGEGFQYWVTAKNQEVINDFLRKRGTAL